MAPWIKEIQTLVQDNTIQALYWYNLLMVNYTAQHLFRFTVQWIDGELTIPRILAFIELTIILL